jgi:DNA-binding transcriptional regulator YhcF (GntR family)
MEIDLKVPEKKPQFVANCIEREIHSGKLASGSRLPGMRTIAEKFSVSLSAVQAAFEILSNKGLVESRLGCGSFVSSRPAASANNESKTIYYLIPHSVHITLQLESSLVMRRLIYGSSLAGDGTQVQMIPVSRKLEDYLEDIDWASVKQIPDGAKVFVWSVWYRKLFPFLKERNVKVVNCFNQYDELEYPEEFIFSLDCGWYSLITDRANAAEQAIQYLHAAGRCRIGFVKLYKNEPLHPFRAGMMSGYEKCGLKYDGALYHEVDRSLYPDKFEQDIVDFWEKTRFDSLVIGHADMFKTVYNTLTRRLKLRIPEDVALISFTDQPDLLNTDVPVSAIDFPWTAMGREIIRCFNNVNFTSGKTVFQASIIERESTRKGTGAFVNHNFMPELPISNNNISYYAAI